MPLHDDVTLDVESIRARQRDEYPQQDERVHDAPHLAKNRERLTQRLAHDTERAHKVLAQ
jgi:hypothetical protein